MDPQAAWNQLLEAYGNYDWESVHELAQSLIDWLERGGFPPVTKAGGPTDTVRQRSVVTRFCRNAILRAIDSRPLPRE